MLFFLIQVFFFTSPLIPLVASASSNPVTTETTYSHETREWTTSGTVKPKTTPSSLAKIVDETEHYGTWALLHINEAEEGHSYLVKIKSMEFLNKEKTLVTKYDLDLPWPLNFRGMSLELKEVERTRKGNDLAKLRFTLAEPNSIIAKFEVTLEVTTNGEQGQLNYVVIVKPTRLIQPFLSRERYLKNIQTRILRVMKNFNERANLGSATASDH